MLAWFSRFFFLTRALIAMRLTLASTVLLSAIFPGLTREITDVEKQLNHAPSLQLDKITSSTDGSSNLRRSHVKKSTVSMIATVGFRPHFNAEDLALRNKNLADAQTMKECIPTSEDPDVGILSCGEGQFCQESVESKLGGVCSAISRRTARISTLQYCDPLCRCTANTTSPTGYIKCSYRPLSSTTNGCITLCSQYVCAKKAWTVTYVNGTETEYKLCFYLTQPYKKTICQYQTASNGFTSGSTCTYTINGASCNVCHSGTYHDCTNVGGIKGIFGAPVVEAYFLKTGPFCTPTSPVASPSSPPPPPTSPVAPPPMNGGGANPKGGKKGQKISSPPAPVAPPPPTSPVPQSPPTTTTATGGPPKGANKKGKH